MLSQSSNLLANATAERTRRSSNFSTNEVIYLLKLVENKKEIIESKKTDRITSEEKIKVWMEIEKEFNSVFEDYRSFKVLKTKYENLKKNVKRKLPTNVSNLNIFKIMQASENPVTNQPLSEFENDISEDENTLLNGNASDVDIKPAQLNEEELDAAAEEYVFETLLFGEAQTSSSMGKQKSISKRRYEQTKHIKDKKRTTVDIWEQVARKKIKKLELEIKVVEEEWKLKKHKLELELDNVRIENRFKEEKIKLELELLKQKIKYNNNS